MRTCCISRSALRAREASSTPRRRGTISGTTSTAHSYGADGRLVGVTIINARVRLERDGKLVITPPEQQVEASATALPRFVTISVPPVSPTSSRKATSSWP